MQIKSIHLKNFRNFEKVDLNLNNKNIIFGRNDFGKTNFLYALRFLFDTNIRKNGFEITDYHKRNTDEKIIIQIELDISDDCDDCQFIRARVQGATSFSKGNFFIQVEGEFDEEKQIGNPVLKWGGAKDELSQIEQKGIYSLLDNIFEVVYISPNISPNDLFKKHRSLLYKETKTDKSEEIKKAIESLNEVISQDSRVQYINSQLTNKYNEIRKEDVHIKLQSEHEVNGVFNHLTPYIHENEKEGNLYPTSGDGRQKILAYALTSLIEELKIEEKADKRISIFLMEEIENSLHPTMQQIISRHLFNENKKLYPYLFVTTHSEHMFMYMDDVELIRIYKDDKGTIQNNSIFYNVPKEFKNTRKTFNEKLAEALFFDKVLLVEGMSEKILFESMLEKMIFDLKEIHLKTIEETKILSVEGIGFEDYIRILNKLGIKVIIKTDNDVKKLNNENKVSLLGIRRCQRINAILENNEINESNLAKPYQYRATGDFKSIRNKIKVEVFEKYKDEIEKWENNGIFLSEIELEEDLEAALPNDHLKELPFDLVTHLQDAKKKNMNEYINNHLNSELAKIIFNDNRFVCLKRLVGVDEDEEAN
ncbi:ATP-dependent nuclease [Pallidibacillus thermolactis]|jgi:putative ATP-dependent endonuclease of the OLD family|uniref:ATP-dependent nuclease n=1 Tax=Pallidibacillus thermolactis TaxID=251051 RepID=UPI002E200357|nr:AAA family ATPase [Pallidibacillus thermolactis subsp. kokeshiiformis]